MVRRVATVVFGTAGVECPVGDAGLTLLRVFAGLTLALAHGLGKTPPPDRFVEGVAALGFPAPALFAWAASLSELVGGLLVALGLATRPAAALAGFTMLVAAFGAHAADPFAKKEMALLFLAIMTAFVFMGSGRFGLDALVRRRLAT
ncbi:MAG: DoxX family protein [Planctomycetes bacterium]|nr:DoxX family protein [Planctomycetota bacterium]